MPNLGVISIVFQREPTKGRPRKFNYILVSAPAHVLTLDIWIIFLFCCVT
jgi:hypothetical protein